MEGETTTQYLEYLYDLPSDEDNDWQVDQFEYQSSGLKLDITTRYSATGVSRSTWEAAYIMGQDIEQNTHLIDGKLRVLELGSGTGLGGLHYFKLVQQIGQNCDLHMTDICEKSLKVIERNLKNNSVGPGEIKLQQFEWGRLNLPADVVNDRFKH